MTITNAPSAWLADTPPLAERQSLNLARLDTAPNGREPALVTVHTRDGRSFETFVMFARGVLQNPMTAGEMWTKYDDCTGDVIDAARAAELRSALEGFETLDRVADLMEIMRWQP